VNTCENCGGPLGPNDGWPPPGYTTETAEPGDAWCEACTFPEPATIRIDPVMVEPGARVEVVRCDDEHTHLEPGLRGTVTGVSFVPFVDGRQVWIDFDDGTRLALLEGVDEWRTVA